MYSILKNNYLPSDINDCGKLKFTEIPKNIDLILEKNNFEGFKDFEEVIEKSEKLKNFFDDFSSLKNKKNINLIKKYSGEVIFGLFDLRNSSNDKNAKNKIEFMFKLGKKFEEYFSDYGLKIFATRGDDISIGFFNDHGKEDDKIKILSLFQYVLNKEGLELNVFFNTFNKKEGEYLEKNNGEEEIFSLSYNDVIHNLDELHKNGGFQYNIGKEIICKVDKNFDFDFDFKGLNINPLKLFSQEERKKYFEQIININNVFGNNEEPLIKAIKHFYYNNLEKKINITERKINSEEDLLDKSDVIEVLDIEKNINVIEQGKENQFVYFSLNDGIFEIKDFVGGDNFDKQLKNINEMIGEISSTISTIASATVVANKGLKLVKIPKSHLKEMLGRKNVIPENKYLLSDTIDKKINFRTNSDYANLFIYNNLKKYFGQNEWIKFGNKLSELFNGYPFYELKDKLIIEENKKNNNFYLLQPGTIYEITKKGKTERIKLKNYTIVGEGTVFGNDEYTANATIKIISGFVKNMPIENARNKIININETFSNNLKYFNNIRAEFDKNIA